MRALQPFLSHPVAQEDLREPDLSRSIRLRRPGKDDHPDDLDQRASGSGAATTTWYCHSYQDWITKKEHQGETDNSDDYDYTAAGRRYHRYWERGTSTTYGYSNAGDLTSINYSDPTPDVTFASDRRDRRLTAAQNGANTATFGYNSQNQVTSETWSVGSLNGLALTLSYDRFLRGTNLNVNTGTAIQNAFAYDNASERFVGSEGDRRKGHGQNCCGGEGYR